MFYGQLWTTFPQIEGGLSFKIWKYFKLQILKFRILTSCIPQCRLQIGIAARPQSTHRTVGKHYSVLRCFFHGFVHCLRSYQSDRVPVYTGPGCVQGQCTLILCQTGPSGNNAQTRGKSTAVRSSVSLEWVYEFYCEVSCSFIGLNLMSDSTLTKDRISIHHWGCTV